MLKLSRLATTYNSLKNFVDISLSKQNFKVYSEILNTAV